MLESLSCPSCFTHYGLRPERVHAGIRRARCLRCGDVFGIEEAVHHLLVPSPEPKPPQGLADFPPGETLEGIHPEDLLELDAVLSAPSPVALPAEDAALSLGDLGDTEDELLEKTLVIENAPPPEVPDEAPAAFSSAKDAISKLLGNTPSPAAERRSIGHSGSMDVEATLEALEHTLGGTPQKSLEQPVAPTPLGSTVRLSPAELHAALNAGAPQPQTQAIPSPISSIHDAATRPAFAPQAPPTSALEVNPTGDPNIFKIQVGQETFQNVTLAQVTTWIEQGRVQDWHMVARQFSDNWIEAAKVPALRPIFDRVRRTQPAELPLDGPTPFEATPTKKGLFGWMSRH